MTGLCLPAAGSPGWAPLEESHLAQPFPPINFLLREEPLEKKQDSQECIVKRETEAGPPSALSGGHVKAWRSIVSLTGTEL